jgi:uncharacterized protein YdeI (YjbR/CyaY-like superfamily)
MVAPIANHCHGACMPKLDPRVDAYIECSAAFAQPILKHLRAIVHAACPDVEETIKWRMPVFTYQGMLCSMAAFKQHAAFGFWKGVLVIAEGENDTAMGQFGRITQVGDLPAKKVLAGYVKRAMQLNLDGVKAPRSKPEVTRAAPEVPEDFAAALKKQRKARDAFDAFSPSHQREYIEWICEAKRAETRQRRLDQSIEWLAEGKVRNWKYLDC